jgi:hypothetical protein
MYNTFDAFLHLQKDIFVLIKEFNNQMYINNFAYRMSEVFVSTPLNRKKVVCG